MRVSKAVAWLLISMALFTSGLLRQYHDEIPNSPYVPPLVGSLLFAAVFFLLLVSARERRQGASPGPGIRLGSLTPLLLMLLIEKWISLGLYSPVFYAISPAHASDAELDAMYRAFAGIGLLLVCLLVGWFSRPAASVTWERARPARWPPAALSTAVVLVVTYGSLALLARALGGELELYWPTPDRSWRWVVGGQGVLAFAEEVFYRGLILGELFRLAPRLGLRNAGARRWFALVSSAGLFAMEHFVIGADRVEMVRQFLFTFSLGVLLGILVLVTDNLHFAAGIHAWINWLLLGAVPRLVDSAGQPALPSGTYIGVGLIVAFCLAAGVAHHRRRRATASGAASPG